MEFSFIPWHVFLDALKKQKPTTVEAWLRRWLFTNEGVILTAVRKGSPKVHFSSSSRHNGFASPLNAGGNRS